MWPYWQNHFQSLLPGGQLIGSLCQGFLDGSLGSLDDISAVVVNQRSYLYLKSKDAQVSTVVLGHRTEEALEELKVLLLNSM